MLNMLDWQFSGPPPLEQAARELAITEDERVVELRIYIILNWKLMLTVS